MSRVHRPAREVVCDGGGAEEVLRFSVCGRDGGQRGGEVCFGGGGGRGPHGFAEGAERGEGSLGAEGALEELYRIRRAVEMRYRLLPFCRSRECSGHGFPDEVRVPGEDIPWLPTAARPLLKQPQNLCEVASELDFENAVCHRDPDAVFIADEERE